MYRMSHDIVIGGQRLRLLEKVVIKRSVENLADTATITLPAYVLGRPIELGNKIQDGDGVNIALGYDGETKMEFSGYVDDIYIGKDGIEIRCMDELWRFKNTSLKDEVLKAPRLKDVLESICQQVDPQIKINCDYDIDYEKFTIFKATAYDVLTKIHEEIKADIYFDNGELHLHPPYSVVNQKMVKLDFARNIETSDLKYIRAKDQKIEVEVTIKKPDGKKHTETYGSTGGKKVSIIAQSESKEEAKQLAENEYNARCFDGYDGSVTGWLLPYVQPAMAISLHDEDLPDRDGKYYVVATETTFSKSGGQRKITLGRRLS